MKLTETYAGIGFVVVMFLVVLAILWFFLPFAIFGTKALIEQQIQESKETNKLLKQIVDQRIKDQ
jgi:hypothetical protein